MKRYKVSLPGFKFTAFSYSDGSMGLASYRDGDPGAPHLCTVWELDAEDEIHAVAKFNSAMGVRNTVREHDVSCLSSGKSKAKEALDQ